MMVLSYQILVYIGTIYDVWFYPHLPAPGDQDWPRLGLRSVTKWSVTASASKMSQVLQIEGMTKGENWRPMDPYGSMSLSMSLSLFKDLFLACSLSLIEKHIYLGVRLTRQSMWKRQSSILNINTALTCCASLLPVKVRVLVGDANSPCCCFCAVQIVKAVCERFVQGPSSYWCHNLGHLTWAASNIF